jgi:hypothetical protein
MRDKYYDPDGEHGVNLDTPFKTLRKAIRCQRCGTLGISVYAQPYCNSGPQPRHPYDNDPICRKCGSDDVNQWPLRLVDAACNERTSSLNVDYDDDSRCGTGGRFLGSGEWLFRSRCDDFCPSITY